MHRIPHTMNPNQDRETVLACRTRRASDVDSQALEFILSFLFDHEIFGDAEEMADIYIDLGTSGPGV
jgi:hypothetical protein